MEPHTQTEHPGQRSEQTHSRELSGVPSQDASSSVGNGGAPRQPKFIRPCQFCTAPAEYRIIKEYKSWYVQIADSQQLLGYTIISLKRHGEMISDLSDEEIIEFRDVCKELQEKLARAFQPDWYNYQQLGNLNKHLHFYLIPRYKEPRIFDGRQFFDDRYGKAPERRWVFEEESTLKKLVEKIRSV